jgi:hypothetical protein
MIRLDATPVAGHPLLFPLPAWDGISLLRKPR